MATLLVALYLALLPGSLASAQAPVASEPRPRQVLTDPPGWVTLAFDRELDASVAKLLVLDSDGDSVTVDRLIVEGTNMTMQLRNGLGRDTYTVRYRVNGPGGEPRGGAFQFAYGSPSWTTLQDASWSGSGEEPEVFRDTDPQGNPIGPEPSATVPDVVVVQSGGPTIEVTTSPTPQLSPTVTATDLPWDTASPTPAETPAPAPAGDGGVPPAAIWGGLAVAALGAAAAVALLRRRRRS